MRLKKISEKHKIDFLFKINPPPKKSSNIKFRVKPTAE